MKSGTCDLWLVDFYFLGWLWKPSFATQQKSWFPRFGKAVVLWLDSKIHSFRDIVSTCFHCKAPWIPWQELAGRAITLDFRWFSNGLVSILDHNVWNFPSGVMLSSVITLRSSNKKLKTHAVHKLRQEQSGISVNTPQWVSLSLHISFVLCRDWSDAGTGWNLAPDPSWPGHPKPGDGATGTPWLHGSKVRVQWLAEAAARAHFAVSAQEPFLGKP